MAKTPANHEYERKHASITNLLVDSRVDYANAHRIAERLMDMTPAEVAVLFARIEVERSTAASDAAVLLREAVDAWSAFDTEHDEVNGGDLVEWFAEWRERAKAALAPAPADDGLSLHPATPITVEVFAEAPYQTTWAEFATANSDTPAEVDACRKSLALRGKFIGGGGAQPAYSVKLVHGTMG